MKPIALASAVALALVGSTLLLADAPPGAARPAFDESLAKSVGADDYGMRSYVLVILKTGPKPMPKGPERDEMFKGHMANIQRLADEGKLAVAGPFAGGDDGWRGMFIFAVSDVDEAKQLTASDPVIKSGEMIAEYHKLYCSAALMTIGDTHKRVAKKSF